MNILITGGVGFIGTNCAFYFSKNKKNKITLVDNFSRIGVEKNAQYLSENTSVKIIKAEVGNVNKYLETVKKSDVILHLAGQTAVTTSIVNPLLDFESNLMGAFNLLETVRKNNPQAIIIYSSTNKVYGDLRNHKLKQNKSKEKYINLSHPYGISENEKVDFISPYGCSKGAIDFYFHDYARIYGLRTVVFRQSCIYGPHQIGVEDQGWVAYFAKQFLLKNPITIFGNGLQVRDLLHVNDLVSAYEKAIIKIDKTQGQVFNIGGGPGNAYSLLEVIDILKKTTKNNVLVDFKKGRLGDQKYFISDNRKVRRMLNWEPKTNFKKGVNELINWQKNFYLL